MMKTNDLSRSLSDEEVVAAILKIMLRSKIWQEHKKQHQDAKLHILATPGFHINNSQESIADKTGKESTEINERLHIEKRSYQPQSVYGASITAHSPASHNIQYGRNIELTQGEKLVYGRADAGTGSQEVIAGCNCGLVFDINAANHNENNMTVTSMKVGYNAANAGYAKSDQQNTAGYGSAQQKPGYTSF